MATTGKKLMFVLAHPDDETFGPGGTIARYASEGARITAVIATSGQAGRAGGFASTPEELGRVREEEARAAARFLGIAEIHFLNYMDGKLDQADELEVEEKVVRLIRRERPLVVVTFGPEGAGNEHRDHKAISQIATIAVSTAGDPASFSFHLSEGLEPHLIRKFYYMSGRATPWREMSRPFMPITTVIDTSAFIEKKIETFRLHRSQQEWMPRLLEWIQANGGEETYHRAASIAGLLPDLEDDLFAGLD